jgi:hypothetical protein
MTRSLPRWVHRSTSRAPLRQSRGGRCAGARVPPMHYLDKLPRPSLGAGKQGGSELDRRTSPKWLRIQPALTARPGLLHRRAGQPMRPPVHVASARQHSGEPSSGLGPNGGRNDRLRGPDLAGLDGEIAGLVDRSTQELRRAWRTLHHTGPPLGLSRDLIIRGLADKRQERAHGGPSRALQRRLRILAGEFEKGARSFDPGVVLKTGTRLVRQWRGHTHTVLVREDGFEYDGQRYRSLTVIAERITGAHWSGPRFFGLTKRARAF